MLCRLRINVSIGLINVDVGERDVTTIDATKGKTIYNFFVSSSLSHGCSIEGDCHANLDEDKGE